VAFDEDIRVTDAQEWAGSDSGTAQIGRVVQADQRLDATTHPQNPFKLRAPENSSPRSHSNNLMKVPIAVVRLFMKLGFADIQSLGNVYGVCIASLGVLIRSIAASIIHYFPQNVTSVQLLFMQSVFALLMISFARRKSFKSLIKVKRFDLQLIHVCCSTTGTLLLFESLKRLPLMIGSVLSLSSIFFSVMGSFLFFSEKPTRRVVIAIMLSCAGLLWMSGANFGQFSWTLLLPMAASFFISCGVLMTKEIAIHDSLSTALFYTFLLQTTFLSIPGFLVWQGISLGQVFILGITAMCIFAGKACALQADSFSAVAFTAPFKTIKVVFSALIGLVFFKETISLRSFLSSCCIIVSYLLAYKDRGKVSSYYIKKGNKLFDGQAEVVAKR
jgi:drug/metabolite transporter (DMT)-like permease